MSITEELLEYLKNKDKKRLVSTDVPISDFELNVVVIKILAWLKLEHKRSIWMTEGKKKCFNPLEVNMQYPWCVNLCRLVEKEKLFSSYFSIKGGKFDFLESVSEEEKIAAREIAYQNYNPQKHE